MECLTCENLINQFVEATARYFEAVDRLANVVDSRSHRTLSSHRRLFLRAKAQAMREFESCELARNAVRRHRSEYHGSRFFDASTDSQRPQRG